LARVLARPEGIAAVTTEIAAGAGVDLAPGWELVPLKYNPRAYVRRERAGHGALTSVTAHHQWNFQEPSALLRRNISHVKGIGHMHSYIRFKRMKHGLILSLLAMLVAVALPGLAEARGGHDGGGVRHGRGHPGGGAASRFGGTGAWLGAVSAGTNHRFNAGGHEGSGWYHRGWGGTMDPGWGYGFGPNLGGSGGP
jgi:hypothetical protein